MSRSSEFRSSYNLPNIYIKNSNIDFDNVNANVAFVYDWASGAWRLVSRSVPYYYYDYAQYMWVKVPFSG